MTSDQISQLNLTWRIGAADSAGDSDSDTSDEINDYYQPISSQDGEGDDDENLDSDLNSNSTEPNINGYRSIHPHSHSSLSNHDYQGASENGMRSVNLSSEGQEDRESQEHEEEEEEERRRAESDGAVRRAFEEDESRRNAPLPAENALRVMEAMRGVSFSGLAPDWASHIPEDRWLDQLRRLWQPPHSAS